MKRIPGMKIKLLAYGFVAILLGSAILPRNAGANGDAIVQTAGDISYVSGGVGAESIARLSSLASNFNLKLVFALKSGAYVSDVRVSITDATGKLLLETTSEGPWFLTKLPVGDYKIVATFAGNAVKHQISIGAAKLKTIDFWWTSE